MISSVQIYNISQNIQEYDLQHLQFFTEFGQLSSKNNLNAKPYQVIFFNLKNSQKI